MAEKQSRRFHYHASAHALSGQFTRPIQHVIEVQAATTLPTIGGHGHSRVDDFRFNHFVSFKAGYTHVSGSEQREADKVFHTTLVTATLEGLNFFDVLTADRLVARISLYHLFEGEEKEKESHFSFVGTKFENLRVAGYPVEVELNERLFAHLGTHEKVKKELETDNEFKKMAEDPFKTGRPRKLGDDYGEILCSLVKGMKTSAPGVKSQGHTLAVDHFGKIFVAETLLGRCKRTLTMLRLELGSPVAGSSAAGQVVGNGEPW
jgi:hypothetical protein